MEIKLIIFILIIFVIKTTVSQNNDENAPSNMTNLSGIELNAYKTNENETIRTKRHPVIILKARPIRLKRLPITTVYRRHPPGPPPPSKYGPPPTSHTSQNLSPPKIRYGSTKHKPSHPISIEYSHSGDFLDSYGKPHSSISDSSSHHNLLNDYQETHLVDTNLYDSYESYKTPLHFSSNSQSNSYEYYPSYQPSIPISNNYNSDSSSSVVSSSSSSGGNKLKFPAHQTETYNENLNSDSYSGTYYSIPSTSYGVPSNTYGEGHVQQQEQHYSSYAPQHQSHSQDSYNYQPALEQHNPEPIHTSHSAVSYSPPSNTYNYQPAPQSPISYKSPPNYQQSNQQGTHNFAEPPQPNQHHHYQPLPPDVPSKPVYSNSVISYNTPSNYPVQHQPTTKLQGAYNTPVPVYTAKNRHSNRATTKQTPNDNIINEQTEKYDFQLDENNNSGSLYDTSISSYDVPVHYNYGKEQKYLKSYPPNENFEPSKPKKMPSPPMLPNIYDQDEFSSFKKSKNEPPKIRQHELQDFSQFFDAAVFKPQPPQKPKKQTKHSSIRPPITNLNAFASYEDILPTTEHYFDEPTTVHTTSTTINPRIRRKKLTKPPYTSSSSVLVSRHNLDTDDLRDAFGSPSHVHPSVIRTDSIAKFESMKNKNRLPPTKVTTTKTKAANNTTKYHSNYSIKQKEIDKYDVVSIEKSKSHSYYAGTISPSLAANLATKRNYNVADNGKHKTEYNNDEDVSSTNTKAFNVFSSGFYVSDASVADDNDSAESNLNSDYYDNDDDFDAAYKHIKDEKTLKSIWNGGSLPKNHKFTSKDLTTHP